MTTYYTIENNTWIKTILSPEKLSWRWIRLYDEELKFKGIGMYPKNDLKSLTKTKTKP
tara:strand:+ start:358 stop:531 length:174 start_codon:yes stop_codon:yes gene_type:complete